jgi:hypothetical protein
MHLLFKYGIVLLSDVYGLLPFEVHSVTEMEYCDQNCSYILIFTC